MEKDIDVAHLAPFLREFTERHVARPVTLQMLEGTMPMTEEERLPLLGLDLDPRAGAAPDVEILLGDEEAGKRHLAHTVSHVRRVTVVTENGNREKRVVFESDSGAQAILTFD